MEEVKSSFPRRIKLFVSQSKRVWHVLKKPSGEEFKLVAKVSAIGILIIGFIGFVISDIIEFFG